MSLCDFDRRVLRQELVGVNFRGWFRFGRLPASFSIGRICGLLPAGGQSCLLSSISLSPGGLWIGERDAFEPLAAPHGQPPTTLPVCRS